MNFAKKFIQLIFGDWAVFLLLIWWLVPKKIGDLVILRSFGDGDLSIFVADLVISAYLKKESKKTENCHSGTKNTWWFESFFLVIGDLRVHLVMVILAIFWWWYGNLSHFLVVIWWLKGGLAPLPISYFIISLCSFMTNYKVVGEKTAEVWSIYVLSVFFAFLLLKNLKFQKEYFLKFILELC